MHIQDANNLTKNALSTHKQKIKGEALKVNEGSKLDFSHGKLHAVSFHSLQALDRKG